MYFENSKDKIKVQNLLLLFYNPLLIKNCNNLLQLFYTILLLHFLRPTQLNLVLQIWPKFCLRRFLATTNRKVQLCCG